MRFVKRDNAACGIAALEENFEANAEECAGRALVDKGWLRSTMLRVPGLKSQTLSADCFSMDFSWAFWTNHLLLACLPALVSGKVGPCYHFLSLGRSVHEAF